MGLGNLNPGGECCEPAPSCCSGNIPDTLRVRIQGLSGGCGSLCDCADFNATYDLPFTGGPGECRWTLIISTSSSAGPKRIDVVIDLTQIAVFYVVRTNEAFNPEMLIRYRQEYETMPDCTALANEAIAFLDKDRAVCNTPTDPALVTAV
jgi:hypothetical protein